MRATSRCEALAFEMIAPLEIGRPEQANASSERPAPTMPASATISPARTSIETSRTRFATDNPRYAVQAVPYAADAFRRKQIAELAADHHRDQALAVDLCDIRVATSSPSFQNRHAVAQREYLLQAMRNKHDRDAFGAQPAQTIEQIVTSRPAITAVGSSSTSSLTSMHHRSDNLDHLLVGDRQRSNAGGRVDRDTQSFQQFLRFAAHPAWSTVPNRVRRSRPTNMLSVTDSCGNRTNSW